MILVLAGVNGAGKSTIGGASLLAQGEQWFNPDEEARRLAQAYPVRRTRDLYRAVLVEGERRLKQAIRDDQNYAFETSLGGDATVRLLLDAMAAGVAVHVWYCGMVSVDLHIERVAARVARGGHPVPESLIRARYRSSLRNLCRLAPGLRELGLYDNSAPLDRLGRPSGLRGLLHMRAGELLRVEIQEMPDWAKPVTAVMLQKYAKS